LVDRNEYFIVASFEVEIILTVDRINNYKKAIRHNNNNYNYELVGIIEFDLPHPLIWVLNNISLCADW
jgi:hypothetical protein